jgi:hypothetical protein
VCFLFHTMNARARGENRCDCRYCLDTATVMPERPRVALRFQKFLLTVRSPCLPESTSCCRLHGRCKSKTCRMQTRWCRSKHPTGSRFDSVRMIDAVRHQPHKSSQQHAPDDLTISAQPRPFVQYMRQKWNIHLNEQLYGRANPAFRCPALPARGEV